jgi:hypothetical protein
MRSVSLIRWLHRNIELKNRWAFPAVAVNRVRSRTVPELKSIWIGDCP